MVRIARWRFAGEDEGYPCYLDGDELCVPDSLPLEESRPSSGHMVHVRDPGQDFWEVYTLGPSRIERGEAETWRVFELRDPGHGAGGDG